LKPVDNESSGFLFSRNIRTPAALWRVMHQDKMLLWW
jgi:hypothetical protein